MFYTTHIYHTIHVQHIPYMYGTYHVHIVILYIRTHAVWPIHVQYGNPYRDLKGGFFCEILIPLHFCLWIAMHNI